ncbi:MAG: N4-gp56 family major capsid protein [Nitrospiraceae bacterium]|nr:N4-gp56 family major capsid protein [Nitrospiraceae bacterium]
MAETTVPSGLTVQQWDERYFTEYLSKNWFKQFMGMGSSKMIQVKEDLTKKPGDAVTFSLVNRLTGTAKGVSESLEGAEEDAVLRSFLVRVREYAHAVRFKKFEAQKTAIDLRQAHKDVLMDWNMELDRNNIIDAMMSINGTLFASADATARNAWLVDNADRVLFGAAKSNAVSGVHATALATIDNTADKLTPAAISLMKRIALGANPKIRPFKARSSIGDTDAYVLFAHPLHVRDLSLDSTFVAANREARNRGMDNPLFSGADYMWENVAIYTIEDIPLVSSTVQVAPAFFCGAQALGIAWSMRPETVEEDFDYKRAVGLAIKQWYKVEKLRFGTGTVDTDDYKDNGIVTGWFAAVGDA